MRVGDRHPKQNFEVVILGNRQYQTNSMAAVTAALAIAGNEMGPLVDVSLIGENDLESRAEAIEHNNKVAVRAWALAAGDE